MPCSTIPDYEDLLVVLSEDRRAHSREVGLKVARVSARAPAWARGDLVTAAILHDIGYGHPVTGFHPLDGARYLDAIGFSPLVCTLVLRHSASTYEAELRGIDPAVYEEYWVDLDVSPLHSLLWWADMTTGPQGQTVLVEDRLDEICERYGPDDLVTEFIGRARSVLLEAGQPLVASK